ncbi:MAG TPA: choice-of-anchor D domain-containing protein, partial [Bacteroidales bacterium]|nr:choice-of-anchor D domain-containing protein [Bacteroidales bacterium]
MIRITTDPHKQYEPRVSGDRIVWTDTRNGNKDIYMWDPWNGEAAVCTAPGDQYMPAIDGDNIVWTDLRNGNADIYVFNCHTNYEYPVVTKPSNQGWPDIEGDYVVYTDDRNGNLDIYMTHIWNNDVEYPIVVKRNDQTHPSISRATKNPRSTIYITYEDQGDVYLYAPFLNEGEGYRKMLPLDYGPDWTYQSNPQYENKQLVYVDYRPICDFIHRSIYVCQVSNIALSTTTHIKLVSSESGADQTNPRIYDDIVVWQYTKGSDSDIYIWKRPPGADLQLTVTESADPVPAGDTLKYFLVLNNDGPIRRAPASVECTIPAEAIFVSATSGKGNVTIEGLKITWNIDSLAYGSEDTLTIKMLTSGDCILTFNATASTPLFDPDPSNNKVSEKTKVKTIFPRSVDKGTNAGMLVEPDGTVHLIYRKGDDYSQDGDLMYASKTRSGKWQYHKIGTCPPYISGFFRLAMTSDRTIHVVYSNQDWSLTPKSRLYYGTLTPGRQWQSKIIAVSDSTFLFPTIDVTSHDELWVAWIKASGLHGTVMIKNTRNGYWQAEKKVGGGYCHLDIAVDGSDNVHLCTYDVNLGIIYYRVINGIPGPPEQVEPGWKGGQKEGLYTSIMTDKMNRPHISYVGQVNNDNRENTKHAWKENNVWFNEKIDNGEYFSSINKVAFDPFNAVNLVYFHLPTYMTRFASNFSGNWIKLPIDGSLNDLAMDASGNGHMIVNSIDYVFIPPLDYIKADPKVLDFEVVQPGASRTLSLVLSNPALKEIRIDSIKSGDERFTVDKTSFVLDGFATDTVNVTFTQSITGAKADNLLTIIYNIPAGLIMEIPLKAFSLAPRLQTDEETVDLGSVPLNSTATKTVILKNTGANDLIFSNINVKYELFPGIPWATDFQLSGHNCSTLHYGETCQVEVSFSPHIEGEQFSYLNIYSNDPEMPAKQIMLTGRTAYASIMPGKTSMNFGYCEAGQSKKDTLIIKNEGGAVLAVSGVAITGANKELFSANNVCQNIQPGDSCIIVVTFAPVTGGDFQANLVINSNSLYSKTITIPLAGSSILRNLTLSDSRIVFGEIPVGHKAFFRLALTNTGSNDVSINEIRVTGTDRYEFSQGYASILCNVLQPGVTCTDTVYFIPLFEGEKNAILTVVSNDSYNPVQTVVLTGKAILNNNSISGEIWDETGLRGINKSHVSLIPMADVADTTLLLLDGSNNYRFGGLPAGRYTVLATPDPVEYPDELPTYYGDNILLNNALWIQALVDITGSDIRLIKKPPTGAGTGIISGTFLTGSSKGISVSEKSQDIEGNPLSGIYVYLKSASGGSLVSYDITGADGGFRFQGLEDGSYIFLADYRGKAMDPANPALVINSGRREIEILATAGAETITINDLATGIDLIADAAIRIYPVPASEKITIQIPDRLFSGKSIRLRIADLSGRYLYINEFHDLHDYNLTIDVSGIKDGLYIIEIGNKEKTLKTRFLIMR